MRLRALPLVLLVIAPLLAQSPKGTLKGTGDTVTDPVTFKAGLVMVGGAHKGPRNFAVIMEGDRPHVAVNVIGDYQGVTMFPVTAGPHRFSVTAQADWVLMYEQPDPSAPGNPLPIEHDGGGDSPLGPFTVKAGLLILKASHRGQRNFSVLVYRATGDLAGVPVNTIGTYSGTTSVRIATAGSYWVNVNADGPWSLALTQD